MLCLSKILLACLIVAPDPVLAACLVIVSAATTLTIREGFYLRQGHCTAAEVPVKP